MAFVALLVGGIGVYALYSWHENNNPIPSSIRTKISFVIFYSKASGNITANKKTIKYDGSTKIFSYLANYNHKRITVSEQAVPTGFIDIPATYTKFIDSLNQYSSVGSVYGNVALTQPKGLNGQQSAVMNADGTLLFAHPDSGNLSDDQWREFFNSLQMIN